MADPTPTGSQVSGIADIAFIDGALYIVHPNHGAIEKVAPDSTITRVIDISAEVGHVVPTGIAVGPDGDFYIGTLMTFPVISGVANVYKLTPDGGLSAPVSGLTAVLGVEVDDDGNLYIVEMSGPGAPDAPIVPGTGRVHRVSDDETLEIIATGLSFPTAMTFGSDGLLYVSNVGFIFPPGDGQIVTIDVSQPAGGTVEATPAS